VVCCVDSPYESTLSYYGSENCEIRRVSTTGRLNLFSLLMAKQCVKSGMKHTYPASNTNYSKNVTEYLFLDE
jgi:hypothetical protein